MSKMEECKENIQDRDGNVKLSSKPEEDDKVSSYCYLACKIGVEIESRDMLN